LVEPSVSLRQKLSNFTDWYWPSYLMLFIALLAMRALLSE
jgi:hypothetical protein